MERTSRTRFWHHHVAQYLGGKQSLKAYCEEHQLNTSTFGYWRRKVAVDGGAALPTAAEPAASATPTVETVKLLRVEMAPARDPRYAPSQWLELVLSSGHSIRVPAGFDAPTLRRLVETVESH